MNLQYKKNNRSKIDHPIQSLEPHPRERTPDPGAIKFTILEEAFFFIITMYLVNLLNIQEQVRRYSKNQCIFSILSFEPRLNTRTLDPGAIKFTNLEEAFFLIISLYSFYLLKIQDILRN